MSLDKALRIGIDARPLLFPSTGIGRYTVEIVKRLADTKHRLYLYTHQPHRFPKNANIYRRQGALDYGQLASLFAQLKYPRWGRCDELDVFWSPRHHLPLFSSVPAVVTVHDMVWRKAPDSMLGLGRILERTLMPPSLRKARAVIAVSQATKADLIEFMPAVGAKTTVIPEAAFTPSELPQTHLRRGRMMLFVGTFEPRKNIPGILRAFAMLIARGNVSHTLVLAGNPGWKEDISALIRELGLADRTVITRPTTQQALEQLYADCDFAVQPAFYEGFGLPILEAMTFGKPVITSNLSAMPEVGGDAALLVDPGSIEGIAAAMEQLITDRDLYQLLSERALKQAAKFSWDSAAVDTLAVLESAAYAGP